MKPYYLQRMTADDHRSLKQIQKDSTLLSHFFDLDYMGSAEFEFGAVGRAIRSFTQSSESMPGVEYEYIECEFNHHFRDKYDAWKSEIKPVKTFFLFRKQPGMDIKVYLSEFGKILSGDRRIKEHIKGDSAFSGFKSDDEVLSQALFDIKNDVVIWYDKRLTRMIPTLFINSIRYMNENK